MAQSLEDLVRNNKFDEWWAAIRSTKEGKGLTTESRAKTAFEAAKTASRSGGSSGFSSFNFGNTSTSSSSGGFFDSIKNTFEVLNKGVKGIASISSAVVETQLQQDDKSPKITEDFFKVIKDSGFNPLKLVLNSLSVIGDQLIDQLKQEAKLRTDINTQAFLTGEISQGLRNDMIEASISAAKYGMNLEDIGKLYITLNELSGKFSLINKTTIESAIPVARALSLTTDQLAEYLVDYEKVGLGTTQTIKEIDGAATRSISLGLNARKIAEDMKTNIGLLNQYGFREGVRGLERMVQVAKEFRMDMSTITTIADKVFNPEGAVEMAARLQVLGGAMGDFGNPMKLMYDATNNVEGLQDSLIGAARALVNYDEQQKKFNITGANMRRAREMAEAMGIRTDELTKIAVASAERFEASQALLRSGLDMKEEDKEFLTNLAQMKDGEMKIMVPESIASKLGGVTEIALDEITNTQKEELLKNRQALEKMDSKKIAENQLTETQNMARDMAVVGQYYRVRSAQILGGVYEGALGKERDKLKKILEEQAEKKMSSSDYSLKEETAKFISNLDFSSLKSSLKSVEMITEKLKELFQPKTTETNKTNQPTSKEQNININVNHNVKTQDAVTGLAQVLQKDPIIFKNYQGMINKNLQDRTFVY